MPNHQHYMQRAIELAEKGLFSARPNPRVGCVIVNNGEIVGEGFHQRAGEPHAEINALNMASEKARGATCYVTLEPCSHQGKTPPCADALIAAGIKTVVVAMTDPNPLVAGQGIARLKAAGIEVIESVLTTEAERLNPGFIQRMRHKRPWLRCKLAMSVDGHTALSNGQSQWLTGESARADVQYWRARSCAIISGIQTVVQDNARLTVRDNQFPIPQQPLRVIVDSKAKLPSDAAILQQAGPLLHAVATEKQHSPIEDLLSLPNPQNQVNLTALVDELSKRECNEVLIESGPTLAGAFWQAGLIDEFIVYVAPKLLGAGAQPLLQLPQLHTFPQQAFTLSDVKVLEQDVRLVYHSVR